MRYAGIDYGKKRVGVALSDEGLSFALPKVVLPNDRMLVKKIAEFCKENDVSLIVVGESLNYKNEENAIMEEAKDFAKKISGVTGVNVVFDPEFLTSAEANPTSTPVTPLIFLAKSFAS